MRIFFEELEILKGRAKKIHFSFPFPEVMEENRDVRDFSTVQFSGEAIHAAGLVVVTGVCQYQAKFMCGRCLTEFQESYDVPIEERFVRDKDGSAKEEDEDEIHRIDEASFELTPYCKEEIFLALPYIPICKPDCLGLCSDCGCNRNQQSCNCTNDHIDPRLADLAKLLNQDQ